jgi:hypothetical protein
MIEYEDSTPNPEYLIKSIAEQGYSFEAAIADLIDNSITAKANQVQILIDSDKEPFKLFIADNGNGMSLEVLRQCIQFPSCSPDGSRVDNDLGRFGLGMKTASFSQTRKFTVLSRSKGSSSFNAFTWDVKALESGEWRVIVNSVKEVGDLLREHEALSLSHMNEFDNFEPNTIIIWSGLYKFEKYLEAKNRKKALTREIAENTSEHLGIVFHRFLDKKSNPLEIRVNNFRIDSFNPFPEKNKGLRSLEFNRKDFGNDRIKLEGFILPSKSMDESKSLKNIWTTHRKSLMDMEGVYIYRANRLIIYGGWNGLIRKTSRLQLARLRVDIGNSADHLLHLNVAKSSVMIPHELKEAFDEYINELKHEAAKEFYNRGISKLQEKQKKESFQLLNKVHSNKGPLLEINNSFPIISELSESLDSKQKSQLSLLFRMINTSINKIRNTHVDVTYEESDGLTNSESIIELIYTANEKGFSKEFIRDNLVSGLGIDLKTLPPKIMELLE